MNPTVSLNIYELKEFLLNIAISRSVFIWGPPGIGKSSVIEQFCSELGLECVPLLGSQLAPEDLIGIPQINGNVSRFVPPSMIVRDKPFCLFIDELNTASSEVQKAFYSLILNQKIGEYTLPKGSIVIGAGNRLSDSALVKQFPSALINRMIHVHLKANSRIWLEWAKNNNIHEWVYEYITARPSHLFHEIAPSSETPFSSPRSWEMVSDGLKSLSSSSEILIEALLYGSLTKEHAMSFKSYIKQIKYKYAIPKLIKGEEKWPSDPSQRDILLFLVESFRDFLIKELPHNNEQMTSAKKQLVIQVKESLKDLIHIDPEYAQIVIQDKDEDHSLPIWFYTEIVKELPKLMGNT